MKKNKFKAILFATILSMISGCGKDIDIINDGISLIEEELSENSEGKNYQNELKFYQFILNKYGKFISQKQFDKMITYIDESLKEESEVNALESILNCNTSFGYGFYEDFISYNLNCANIVRDESYNCINVINTLNILCESDEYYQSIFSNDIDKVVNSISNSIGLKDTILVEKLFLQMDIFHSAKNLDTLIIAKENIDNILKEIIEYKIENDEDFRKSVVGTVLEEDIYGITYNVKTNICTLKYPYEGTELSFYVYYDELINSEDIVLNKGANNIIEDQYIDYAPDNTMELLSVIVDEKTLDMMAYNLIDKEERKLLLYESLNEYFSDINDFNIFLIKLENRNADATIKYMEILKSQLMSGYTIENNARYRYFISLYCEHLISNPLYHDIENIENEPRKEVEEKYGRSLVNDTLFGCDITPYIDELNEYFSNQKNEYLFFENPVSSDYTIGNFYINETTSYIYSKECLPMIMEFKGNKVICYEVPEGFEEMDAIYSFENYFFRIISERINGITEITEDGKIIFIVDFDINNINNYPNVRFKKSILDKKNENVIKKELTNEI